jgi:hypothetical protein
MSWRTDRWTQVKRLCFYGDTEPGSYDITTETSPYGVVRVRVERWRLTGEEMTDYVPELAREFRTSGKSPLERAETYVNELRKKLKV